MSLVYTQVIVFLREDSGHNFSKRVSTYLIGKKFNPEDIA